MKFLNDCINSSDTERQLQDSRMIRAIQWLLMTWGPFYWHGLTSITAWISNRIPNKVYEINYPFLNFNSCTRSKTWLPMAWQHKEPRHQQPWYSVVHSFGHCHRWCSRMQAKIVAGSLFIHCKIAYFNSVITEQWLFPSLPNFVTMRKTRLTIPCKIFS